MREREKGSAEFFFLFLSKVRYESKIGRLFDCCGKSTQVLPLQERLLMEQLEQSRVQVFGALNEACFPLT